MLFQPLVGAAGWLLFTVSQAGWGQPQVPLSAGEIVLTNFSGLWSVPPEQRSQPQHIQTEVVIYYFDADWNGSWGECQGIPSFLPLGDSPTPFKPGQRVRIDGQIVPLQERFVWDKTRVQIVEEGVERPAEVIHSLNENPAGLKGRLVSVEGVIDSMKVGPSHLNLNFLANGIPATAYVLKDKNQASFHFKPGNFIRVKCIYAPQLGTDGELDNLDLWIARPEDIEVIGELKTDPRFARPVTPIEQIAEGIATNEVICVTGTVRKHEPGRSVIIWDNTGQVIVQSKQTQPLRPGDRIEAIGYPATRGVEQYLRTSLYRPAAAINRRTSVPADPPDQIPLRLAEQVRELSRTEAALGLTVKLRAVVTWSHSEKPFAYVQDASGGIRVANPVWDAPDSAKPGTIVQVEGVTCVGDFVPVVTNAILRRVGWWNISAEKGQLVTLEQALTGAEEGRWVEMRGYVRKVNELGALKRIELTTLRGEFEAWVPSSRNLKYLEDSTIRLQGVCRATANARHQLTGAQIWIPESKFIIIEQPKSEDIFAAPLRTVASLRQFNIESALNRRLRTSGTVVMHVPGRYLYVQDGADAVFALSLQTDPLQPGDRVEVVGFPGNEGRKFLLREAAYRRISSGPEHTPVQLPAVQSLDLDLEGRLVKSEGILLNAREKDNEIRLLIHARDSAFEVSLASSVAEVMKGLENLELGSRLAVTGVYEIQSDEYGKPRSFLLHLRSWNDVRLVRKPPWWTPARLLWVLLGVLIASVIGLTWSLLITRKNRLLKQAQAELKAANDQLELRVQERTRELQEQVVAKERARAELAEAQEHLVLTSHRAGMAEVATGVLHNVGNVLNSVNVSASILSERLRRFSVESIAKAAALLKKPQDQLARFLTEDAKGKALPGYFEKLGDVLVQDKRELQSEIESLAKNIDHIKTIVSLQQSYAKVGGMVEELDPKDLAEDAIQINSASYGRNSIRVIRDYNPAPRVMVDRHKVLQILVNLVSNARHALNDSVGDKSVTLSIRAFGQQWVRVIVSDNGMGIAPENLTRIFSQGFTTRKDGHGFGLHSGAIAAKELGGSLTVHSEGLGRGATFSLELPAVAPVIPKRASAPAVSTGPA
jgi:signal transduction histidine kinase